MLLGDLDMTVNYIPAFEPFNIVYPPGSQFAEVLEATMSAETSAELRSASDCLCLNDLMASLELLGQGILKGGCLKGAVVA